MPTQKTIATELSLCFGVLGIPVEIESKAKMLRVKNVNDKYLNALFDFYGANQTNKTLIDKLWQVGSLIAPSLRQRVVITPESTEWSGPVRQSASTRVGRDLVFSDLLSVSVKAKSNVVSNRSPRAIIEDLPSGSGSTSQGRHWYYDVAPEEYQRFYSLFNPNDFGLPQDVKEYDGKNWDRKRDFLEHVKNMFPENSLCQRSYLELCNKVMVESAKRFTDNMQKLMDLPGSNPMILNLCEHFFRINTTPYVLTGIDGDQAGQKGMPFAIEVPSATEWNSKYQIKNIEAAPGIGRRQPVLFITIRLLQKDNNLEHTFNFRLELRWSHGKFCGAPEGKLYKEFSYAELPWTINILN